MGKGWVAAGDLAVGDSIQAISGDAGIVTGLELEKLDRPISVYNLDVEDFHSYFVADGVLVHNRCGKPDTPDEAALTQLAKDAKKAGINRTDAETLLRWADEYGVPHHGDWLGHAGRGNSITKGPHIHIGPVNHIPVIK